MIPSQTSVTADDESRITELDQEIAIKRAKLDLIERILHAVKKNSEADNTVQESSAISALEAEISAL